MTIIILVIRSYKQQIVEHDDESENTEEVNR